MNNQHPRQLKKSKSWGPFWSYQLKALPIQPIYHENGPNGLNWQCCLAGSSKTAPTILIFSIAMGADYSFELISIVHSVPQFFMHNKSILGRVWSLKQQNTQPIYIFNRIRVLHLDKLKEGTWLHSFGRKRWLLCNKYSKIGILWGKFSQTKNTHGKYAVLAKHHAFPSPSLLLSISSPLALEYILPVICHFLLYSIINLLIKQWSQMKLL